MRPRNETTLTRAPLLSDRVNRGVSPAPSGRVVVGFNWTAVERVVGDDRSVGLAATPSRRDGARTTSETGNYGGRTLDRLAALTGSDNPYERAIGLAACNAHSNRAAVLADDRSARIVEGDGLAALPGERVVVIGRFPGVAEKLPGAAVLERNPGPGDIPADRAPEVVPGADRLIVTATALVNGTADALIALSRSGCAITLIGPGAPLRPDLLHPGEPGARVLDRLAGFVVDDAEGCLKAVMEGAGARALRRFGRPLLLEAAAG